MDTVERHAPIPELALADGGRGGTAQSAVSPVPAVAACSASPPHGVVPVALAGAVLAELGPPERADASEDAPASSREETPNEGNGPPPRAELA